MEDRRGNKRPYQPKHRSSLCIPLQCLFVFCPTIKQTMFHGCDVFNEFHGVISYPLFPVSGVLYVPASFQKKDPELSGIIR